MTLDESSSLGIGLGAVSASSVIAAQTDAGADPDDTDGGTGTFGIQIKSTATNENIILDSSMRVANFKQVATTKAPTTLFSGTDVRASETLGFITAWDGNGFEHPLLTRTISGLTVAKKNLGSANSGTASQLGIITGSSPAEEATLTVMLVEY